MFQIDLAPLRERRDDIELLAQAFLEELIQSEGRAKRFSDRALEMLAQYKWPGNVRELRERGALRLRPLGRHRSTSTAFRRKCSAADGARTAERGEERVRSGTFTVRVGSTIAEVERRLILATLREYSGRQAEVRERPRHQPEDALQPPQSVPGAGAGSRSR